MIKINVTILGPLVKYFPRDNFILEIAENKTVNDIILAELGLKEKYLGCIIPYINHKVEDLDYKLIDGDNILLSPFLTGG